MKTIALLWRLPLAALSMIFYKTAGALFRSAMRRYNKKHPEAARRWRVLSGETLKMPIALPAVMTTGPRWNTHAIVATAGPLRVAQSLEIGPAQALQSAKSWSVVVCTFPEMKTVTHVGSASVDSQGNPPRLTLAPGNYWLALRYYHWTKNPELPSVRVDEADVVPVAPVSPLANDFYRELPSRANFVYRAMHYHMWVLLRNRGLVSSAFIERQYLPLGNPDTEFYFGCTNRKESIRINVRPEAFSGYDVFLTVYSLASLPVLSSQITAEQEIITPAITCTYLIRVQRARPNAIAFRREWVSATVV